MMKRYLFLIIVFINSLNLFCQRNELGVFLGGSYYLGDLNPGKQFLLPHPAFGFLYRYNFNPRFAYKLNVFYGTVSGADSVSKANVQRNLSFKSSVLEMSNEIELNFISFVPGNLNYIFTPYIFGGITIFYFDPMAKYNGHWYSLEPLGTEGQGTSEYPGSNKYSRTGVAFPFGVGVKFNLSRYICIGLEWGLRKTFTDYLDDVSTTYADPNVVSKENGPVAAALADRSIIENGQVRNDAGLQRGNSKTKDWYSFAGLIVTFKIKNQKTVCPIYQQHYNYKSAKLYQ
jgi:hypothetical protein